MYDYGTGYDAATSGYLAAYAAYSTFISIITFAIAVFAIVCLWKVFVKAGEEGWKAIIPIYNLWTLAEISGKPGWWSLLIFGCFLIPIIGWIAGIVLLVMLYIETAKSFGESAGFGVGLALLSVIFMAILAFGKSQYIGPGGVPAAPTAPTPPPATPAA